MKPKYPVTYKGLTIYDAKGREVVTYQGDYMRKHMEDACDDLNRRRFKKVRVTLTKSWNDAGGYTSMGLEQVNTIDWNKAIPCILGSLIGNSIGIGILIILGFL